MKHAIQILIDVTIPKTQNFELLICKVSISAVVSIHLRADGMLAAIDLYNEPLPQTDEVQNTAVAWRLPPKMKSAGLP